MLSYLQRSKSEGKELKNEVLWFISVMRPSLSRFYRTDLKTGEHFVSYFYSDLKYQRMYEVGFKYLSFRNYIHITSLRYTLVILTVVCLVIFGFRLFLYGALIQPLDSLMAGVTKVNKGDYHVRIPISVADELGFLGKSFNRMVRSIRGAKARLLRHAGELEAKVKDRTSELVTTIGEIQELKTHQDGDYFLTSLLIKPLSKNNNKSERVHVEFMISQKKKFQFRSYKEEIGGDICVSYNITLRNRPMSVFLNADAMGKSMQGAAAEVPGALDVERHQPTKLLQRELGGGFSQVAPGVVHEHVQAGAGLGERADHAVAALGAGDIGGDGHHALGLVRQGRQGLGAAGDGDHGVATRGEEQADRPADAFARPGHQGQTAHVASSSASSQVNTTLPTLTSLPT